MTTIPDTVKIITKNIQQTFEELVKEDEAGKKNYTYSVDTDRWRKGYKDAYSKCEGKTLRWLIKTEHCPKCLPESQ